MHMVIGIGKKIIIANMENFEAFWSYGLPSSCLDGVACRRCWQWSS
jgi:hypothetical protein